MSKGITTIVVQFNLSNEKFRVISFPASFSPSHVSLGLTDIRGIVALVQCNSRAVRSWKIRDGKGEDALYFLPRWQLWCTREVGWRIVICIRSSNEQRVLLTASGLYTGTPRRNAGNAWLGIFPISYSTWTFQIASRPCVLNRVLSLCPSNSWTVMLVLRLNFNFRRPSWCFVKPVSSPLSSSP